MIFRWLHRKQTYWAFGKYLGDTEEGRALLEEMATTKSESEALKGLIPLSVRMRFWPSETRQALEEVTRNLDQIFGKDRQK